MEKQRVPKLRWTMVFLCFMASTIIYIDRAKLAVAAPMMQHELGISAMTMGCILGVFFWTYSAMQIAYGWFADRVGARMPLTVAVVWWSAFTALTAVARGFASIL